MHDSLPVTPLDDFLERLRHQPGQIEFEDTLALIEALYTFTPLAFHNGTLHNAAGQNSGSCRLFAFARRNGLTEQETLACFGRHYREVLQHPEGDSHPNIRRFMASGWAGIAFEADPLVPRRPR